MFFTPTKVKVIGTLLIVFIDILVAEIIVPIAIQHDWFVSYFSVGPFTLDGLLCFLIVVRSIFFFVAVSMIVHFTEKQTPKESITKIT